MTPPHQLDPADIEERLIRDYGYPPTGARIAASRLASLTGPLADAFYLWWTEAAKPTIEIERFTCDRLHAEHGMNEIAALLTLDWLRRDPVPAHASLNRGHDSVEVRRPRS